MVFIETNIIGTLNLLETSKNYFSKGKKKNFKFLHISTDEVYGSLKSTGTFSESTPYDPSSLILHQKQVLTIWLERGLRRMDYQR